MAAAVQRSGGSKQHPAQILDERLASLAAAVEVSAGSQALSADFQCLKEDAGEVLGLLGEIIRWGSLVVVMRFMMHQNAS